MELQSRFWSKVKTVESGCMEWQSYKRGNYYGAFRLNKKTWSAHRLALRLSGVFFNESLSVMHKCDNTICVNPLHLVPGTHSENMQDKIKKGRDHNQRKTHCPSGHEYSGANMYVNPQGSRKCKTCMRLADKKHYQKNIEQIREKKRLAVLKHYHENKEAIKARRKLHRQEKAALSRQEGGSNEWSD